MKPQVIFSGTSDMYNKIIPMKKLIGLITVLFAFAGYSTYKDNAAAVKTTPSPTPSAAPTITAGPTETLAPSQAPSATPTPVPPTATPAPSAGKYKDGEYTSDVADAVYGPMQLKIKVEGGKLTHVEFLQYPNDRETSRLINTQAMPLLQTEAIAAQSGQVDIISGATSSSHGFITALTQVLSRAQ
jgi:uncharacterized protein with FMN-binding domain